MTSTTICSHHRIRTEQRMEVDHLSASHQAQAKKKETRKNLKNRKEK